MYDATSGDSDIFYILLIPFHCEHGDLHTRAALTSLSKSRAVVCGGEHSSPCLSKSACNFESICSRIASAKESYPATRKAVVTRVIRQSARARLYAEHSGTSQSPFVLQCLASLE